MQIKKIRQLTGMSQAQFAAYFNIPLGTLSHWEQGIRKPPQYVVFMIEKILISDNLIRTGQDKTMH